MRNVKKAVSLLLVAALVLTAPAGNATTKAAKKGKKEKAKVSAVTITNTDKKLRLQKGKKFRLKTSVKVKPNKSKYKKLKFTSSNKKAVIVNSRGLLKGVKEGTAKITAVSVVNPKKKASVSVSVTKDVLVTDIQLDRKTIIVDEFNENPVPLKIKKILPSNAKNKEVKWESSDEEVADVDEEGVVTTGDVGTATITASAADRGGASAICRVVVTESEDKKDDEGRKTAAPQATPEPPVVVPQPTEVPAVTPAVTEEPTMAPEETLPPAVTEEPTVKPTMKPTMPPEETLKPTRKPTMPPAVTEEPTRKPTMPPEETLKPTRKPTMPPAVTEEPTLKPTMPPAVTAKPTMPPAVTAKPTMPPAVTVEPSKSPNVTLKPTRKPTMPPKPKWTPDPVKKVGNVTIKYDYQFNGSRMVKFDGTVVGHDDINDADTYENANAQGYPAGGIDVRYYDKVVVRYESSKLKGDGWWFGKSALSATDEMFGLSEYDDGLFLKYMGEYVGSLGLEDCYADGIYSVEYNISEENIMDGYEFQEAEWVDCISLQLANEDDYEGMRLLSIDFIAPEPVEKNPEDVAALEKLIAEQRALGASVSEDLDSDEYRWWNKDGRLADIDWEAKGLRGDISFASFTELKAVNCGASDGENELSSLDVSGNPALEELFCYGNQLSSLDVSGNPSLTRLDCTGNQLISLDVSKNQMLTYLFCRANGLSALDVSGNPALEWLDCSINQLSSLDVSGNPALVYLNCIDDQLSSLDVSKNQMVRDLYCSINQLSSLDVSGNPALASLSCGDNQLTSLDVSGNPALGYLDCRDNQLTSLDVSGNPALAELSCHGNQLTSLDVSGNAVLASLYCDGNQLTSLDVSGNAALANLDCRDNQLTSLDVSGNPVLGYLDCRDNQLTSLDVSSNKRLRDLQCDDTVKVTGWMGADKPTPKPTVPPVGTDEPVATPAEKNPEDVAALEKLIAEQRALGATVDEDLDSWRYTWDENGRLTKIAWHAKDLKGDISFAAFAALKELRCENNQLISLDVSENTALTYLWCKNNQLISLDVSGASGLDTLNCQDNQLSSLDLSNNKQLSYLKCDDMVKVTGWQGTPIATPDPDKKVENVILEYGEGGHVFEGPEIVLFSDAVTGYPEKGIDVRDYDKVIVRYACDRKLEAGADGWAGKSALSSTDENLGLNAYSDGLYCKYLYKVPYENGEYTVEYNIRKTVGDGALEPGFVFEEVGLADCVSVQLESEDDYSSLRLLSVEFIAAGENTEEP